MNAKNSSLPRSAWVNLILSGASVLVGVILVIIFAPRDGGVAAALNTLGTTLLTIGIVSFASEHILRKSLTRDLLAKIGLRDRLHNAGIEDVSSLQQSDFTTMFESTTTATIALLRPAVSLEKIWGHVQTAAQSPLIVNLYLPDSTAKEAAGTASRLNVNESTFRTSIDEAVETVKRRWKRAAAGGLIHANSEINVYLIPVDFGHSLVATDVGLALILEPFDPADGNELVTTFQFRSKDELSVRAKWLRQSESDLLNRTDPPEWSGTSTSTGGTY